MGSKDNDNEGDKSKGLIKRTLSKLVPKGNQNNLPGGDSTSQAQSSTTNNSHQNDAAGYSDSEASSSENLDPSSLNLHARPAPDTTRESIQSPEAAMVQAEVVRRQEADQRRRKEQARQRENERRRRRQQVRDALEPRDQAQNERSAPQGKGERK